MSRVLRTLSFAISLLATRAHADVLAETPSPDTHPSAPEAQLSVAALPLLNFTTDRGVGFGGFGAVSWRRPHADVNADPAMLALQLWFTTGGYQFHKVTLDVPNIANTGLRFDTLGGYEAWDRAWYFGSGASRPRQLHLSTQDMFYRSRVDAALAMFNLRVPPWKGIEPFVGVTFRHARVVAYPDTLLVDERPVGIEGGLLGQLTVGMLTDTRDREPSPKRGVFSEVSVRGAQRGALSDFSFVAVNATHRQWLSLLPQGRLVLAVRGAIDLSTEGRPFFQKHVLGGSQYVELGGNSSLRGLLVGRYRGDVVILGTGELRWQVFDGEWSNTQVGLNLTGFFETAHVSDWSDLNQDGAVHPTLGFGPRVTLNHVFVLRADVGFGVDDVVIDREVQRRMTTGMYVLFGQSF